MQHDDANAMSHPTIYYMRHGETAWSLSGQHTGKTDLALTGNGEEQARQLRRSLRDINFGHVFTSPRQRARHTCELAGLGQIATTEPDLAEWDYGDYEGILTVDIRRQRPDWSILRDGCPHGEMPGDVVHRADRLIARLRTLKGNIALFSHGQFGQVFVARWIGWPVIEGRHFVLDPASVSILGYKQDSSALPVIRQWNSSENCVRT